MLTRRRFLRESSAAALAVAAGCGSERETAPEGTPNILVLLTDDQRWDTIGAAGNSAVKTPNMDRLASEGVRFVNNFVTTSICAVSRASIFTGLYARCHGVHDFRTPLSPELHAYSYPVRLREEAGYRTGFIGKYGVGDAAAVADAGSRYDYFEGFPGQGRYLVDGRAHMTEHLGNQAVEFLDGSSADSPWCLSISFKAPHVQDGEAPYFLSDPKYDDLLGDVELPAFSKMDPKYFNELPEYLRQSENRVRWEQRFRTREVWEESVKRYYALIHGVDVQIGRLLGELENRGMLDNTLVLFTGDNGFYLGERGLAGKWYMHEESIRTPLVATDFRRPAGGSKRSEMTLNIDVSPTILSYAGLPIPDSMNGRDLRPLITGETESWRTEWFYEHLFEHPRIPKSEGVRTEQWKYFVFPHNEPRYETLYDLVHDPEELKNLASSREHAERLAEMRQKREQWIQSLEAWDLGGEWTEPASV